MAARSAQDVLHAQSSRVAGHTTLLLYVQLPTWGAHEHHRPSHGITNGSACTALRIWAPYNPAGTYSRPDSMEPASCAMRREPPW